MNILNMSAADFLASVTMPARAAALQAEGAARTAAMLEEHERGVAEMQLRASQRQAAFDAEVATRRAARDEDAKNRMDAIERESITKPLQKCAASDISDCYFDCLNSIKL